MEKWVQQARRALGWTILGSMGVTALLLVLEGRWRDVIPLHLCSLSALAAACLALRPRRYLLDFLWYLGMPGAALALLFPSPAVSRFQVLMSIAYVATHLLILLIPAGMMAAGMRPNGNRAGVMLALLQGIALCAACVNALLGTDFLFLSAPPMSAPLQGVYSAGYPVYLALLETVMAALCLGMERLARWVWRRETEQKA